MPKFSKSVRRQIRRIRDQAYELQLHEALRDLDSGFSDWRKGHVDCFQLTDLIHDFHQGPNRELYNYYTRVEAHVAAARAIARGLVRPEVVPSEVREALAEEISSHERMTGDPE